MILSGKPVAEHITAKASERIEELKAKGIMPKLAVIRVGARPDDLAYERGIIKRFEMAGCDYEVFEIPEDCTQEDLDRCIDARNADEKVSGILLFRPLPKHLSGNYVRDAIDSDKDIDAMGLFNQASLFAGISKAYAPCTAQAVMEILHYYNIDLTGKRAVVVGRSLVIGKPVSLMLIGENATVTVCHTKTKDLAGELKAADIIVASAGVAKMITSDMVSPGQVIIDVGMNTDENGNLCGDVDYEGVSGIVDSITPVPGGVGAVTTSVLLKNTVEGAFRINHDKL
ncbi:methylenetetrahydrofolate dehydrogenase (NADP+) / methenyltetrahydrofolate cyclohydrolase [Ruminococcaceae bacterium YRB3002]|nr:methylenetetrahydrofolate dehydrogenase (NADP+) / methenyltetrahydrofolate cyclohydrolase [Ruminococcaceae bacterium YRB3002]